MSMYVETFFPGRARGRDRRKLTRRRYCHSSTEWEALPSLLALGSESRKAESPAEAPGWQNPLSAAAEAPAI